MDTLLRKIYFSKKNFLVIHRKPLSHTDIHEHTRIYWYVYIKIHMYVYMCVYAHMLKYICHFVRTYLFIYTGMCV